VASLGRRALLSAVALGLALAGAEGGTRLLRPQTPALPETGLLRGAFTTPGAHPVRSEVFTGTVQVNAQGFVDGPWGPRQAGTSQPGAARVVVIGDSFVQAAQVPLTAGFGRVLARELSEDGAPVEVLSLGVPGAGTGTALLLARAWLAELQPDLVLYAMTTSNDVLNNHPELDPKPDKPFFARRGAALVQIDPQDAAVPLWARGALWRHSHLLRWIGRTFWTRAEVAARLERGGGLPIELRVHDPSPSPDWEEAWALTGALIGALAEESADHGADFATLLFPDAVEATAAGRAEATARWPALAAWDTRAAARRAAALAEAHGPVLDLQPAIAAAEPEGSPLYLDKDGHWTEAGHRVAAEASAPFVQALLAGRE